jgi:hypothetical protein
VSLRLQLDPARDMQRLHSRDRRYAGAGAPLKEFAGRARVRTPRVRIADCRREEFEETNTGAVAGRRDQGGTVAPAGRTRFALATGQRLDLAFEVRRRSKHEQLDRETARS